MKHSKLDLSVLAENWTSPFVVRSDVALFSGGILQPKHLANLDSQGKGPPRRIRIGRKVAYPVDSLLRWLEDRSELIINCDLKHYERD